MDYVVLVKGVPDFRQGKVAFKEDNTLDRSKTPTVLNPNDRQALEAALEAKVKHGGTVHVICMGPPNYRVILQAAMDEVYGDKLYLLSDRALGGADTLATAEALQAGIRKIGKVEVVFAGFKTADGETGQTGPQTAWKLGYPLITHVTKFDIDTRSGGATAERVAYDEVEQVEAPLPCFVVTDPSFQTSYRRAEHLLKHKELRAATRKRATEYEKYYQMWGAADLTAPNGTADSKRIGIGGSPTIVRAVDPIPQAPQERTAQVLKGDAAGTQQAAKRVAAILAGGR
jgi:electron transfer flavoprotein beta subunit